MNIFRIIGTLGLLISFVKLISPLHFGLSPFHSPSLCLWRLFAMGLKTVHPGREQAVVFFGPVWEIHDHPLGRGGFWHSDLPSFLWIVCCAGSEWTQFIIRSIHQAYSVGTNCQCNHQRRERSSRFASFLDPSFSPAQQNIPSSTGQYLVCIYSMDNMLVPSLTLV